MNRPFVCIMILFFSCHWVEAQQVDNETIKARIGKYKLDARGPYKDIRWFCKDGSYALPQERCSEPGAVQRARYKDEIVSLAQSNHIFLGQILATTPYQDFWDKSNYYSRIKQYQIGNYLQSIDDGWVLKKGQYYRGAFQVEDEEAWGIDFFTWLLQQAGPLEEQFYLIRQAARDIPHKGDDSYLQNIRAVSKAISDEYPEFQDLRVKIHGQPDASDIDKVIAFQNQQRSRLSASLQEKMTVLIRDLKEFYKPLDLSELNRFINQLPEGSDMKVSLLSYLKDAQTAETNQQRAAITSSCLVDIRSAILEPQSSRGKLALLDLSNALEEILLINLASWQPGDVAGAMDKIYISAQAAAGTGLLEIWEWDVMEKGLSTGGLQQLTLEELTAYLTRGRSVIEWGTGTVNAVYKEVINTYTGFEPKTSSFFDDRIRSSVLLPLGDAVGALGGFLATKSNLTNQVMNIPNQSTFRGLNPGYAKGKLEIVTDMSEDLDVSKDRIYVFIQPPSDLKPVAGILTVSEGNMVSHVQLLARNLGIPNAVLSSQSLELLRRFQGQEVFYAVSNRGTVLMKPASDMDEEEKALFEVRQRKEERVSVPVEKIDLAQQQILNMREVDASASGKLCGPKAANLGQLKKLFPDYVVEGIVLPFGVFRMHMDQQMPGSQETYWEFLTSAFKEATQMKEQGRSEAEIETYTLAKLARLREAIQKMPLLPSFVSDLDASFSSVLGGRIGQVPIFIRSDTNMEDLKEFTGAGLNLTLFNLVNREKILQGIRDVWASPYTERSFKWRQRYLLNPENVFPSILIIPSVDVDVSGVMITKGVTNGVAEDLTVAFSRGAGGAVDGQAAESYLLTANGGNYLLSPARESVYRRLPATGGSDLQTSAFKDPVLTMSNLDALRTVAEQIRTKIPESTGAENSGPYDVELGFKGEELWLFQIRPFVENKQANASTYLERISPTIPGDLVISLSESL